RRCLDREHRAVFTNVLRPVLQILEWLKRTLHGLILVLSSLLLFLCRGNLPSFGNVVGQNWSIERHIVVAFGEPITFPIKLLGLKGLLNCVDRERINGLNWQKSRVGLRDLFHLLPRLSQ